MTEITINSETNSRNVPSPETKNTSSILAKLDNKLKLGDFSEKLSKKAEWLLKKVPLRHGKTVRVATSAGLIVIAAYSGLFESARVALAQDGCGANPGESITGCFEGLPKLGEGEGSYLANVGEDVRGAKGGADAYAEAMTDPENLKRLAVIGGAVLGVAALGRISVKSRSRQNIGSGYRPGTVRYTSGYRGTRR